MNNLIKFDVFAGSTHLGIFECDEMFVGLDSIKVGTLIDIGDGYYCVQSISLSSNVDKEGMVITLDVA